MKHARKKEVTFTEARQRLTAILDDVEKSGKPVTILRRGKPAAVIISHEMYEQEVKKTKPFRLAGSFKVTPGVDIDEALARSKRERIEAWEKRLKEPIE